MEPIAAAVASSSGTPPGADGRAGTSPLRSFFMGGIECSTHRRRDGRRVDPLVESGHGARHAEDVRLLAHHGLRTLRSGVRWPMAEPSPGLYRFTALAARARSARLAGVQVVWDLCHYGYPDDLDPFSAAFVQRFAAYALAAAHVLADETDGPLVLCPINEISFWAWAGGDVGYLNPHAHGRGFELKVNLVRATMEAMEAIRAAWPATRFLHAEPLVGVAADCDDPEVQHRARCDHEAQFEALDLLAGRRWPGLGGHERYLDLLGANHYPQSQWAIGAGDARRALAPHDPGARSLRGLLAELWQRYGRPIVLAETGAEGDARVPWMRYVGDEVCAALAAGIPIHGLCLYPALDYPGWDDDRHCPTGLIGGRPDVSGARTVYVPLADEIARQRDVFADAGIAPSRLCVDSLRWNPAPDPNASEHVGLGRIRRWPAAGRRRLRRR